MPGGMGALGFDRYIMEVKMVTSVTFLISLVTFITDDECRFSLFPTSDNKVQFFT